jgi:hypothetical protein
MYHQDSGDMLTNRLTKPLLNTSFDQFIQQLGLVNVSDQLENSDQEHEISLENLGWFE